MNRGFVLLVLLVLVLDWVFVFEDEEEHEDESGHGPNAWEKSERGLSMNQPTPDPSQEGSRRSSASFQFPSWEGLGVGSWSQRTAE